MVVASRADEVTAAWVNRSASGWQIESRSFSTGSRTWSEQVNLSGFARAPAEFRVTQAGHARVLATWLDTDGETGQKQVWAAGFDTHYRRWTPRFRVDTSPPGDDASPLAVAGSPLGDVVVIWQRARPGSTSLESCYLSPWDSHCRLRQTVANGVPKPPTRDPEFGSATLSMMQDGRARVGWAQTTESADAQGAMVWVSAFTWMQTETELR